MSVFNLSGTKDNKYLVYSVFNEKDTPEVNNEVHNLTKHLLKCNNINFKEVEGSYKGSKEKGFISHYDNLDFIVELCNSREQESILLLHEADKSTLRPVELVLLDRIGIHQVIELGYLRQVPAEVALKQDSYTYDSLHDRYYIVQESRECFIGRYF